ncbi:MAG: DUF4178 domain-containing protein [Candidatus Melainabacteria bacterium]|nr:DUF4178 domain-containing protein [Candidatus Melainabacteria bacterium]
MLELSCPACGAQVAFKSRSSVFAVCSFCKTSAVRHDMDLEAIGKIADLQYDLTPFQVGTTGMYDGKKFEIIGRLKVAYDNGFWNEWHTISGGDDTGWLAEAQGFLAMCFELNDISSIPALEGVIPGKLINIPPNGYMQVEDMRQVHCIYSEGELPMAAAQGRRSMSVDLVGEKMKMGTIEYGENVRVYAGHYQHFEKFEFQNLRRIDGW